MCLLFFYQDTWPQRSFIPTSTTANQIISNIIAIFLITYFLFKDTWPRRSCIATSTIATRSTRRRLTCGASGSPCSTSSPRWTPTPTTRTWKSTWTRSRRATWTRARPCSGWVGFFIFYFNYFLDLLFL